MSATPDGSAPPQPLFLGDDDRADPSPSPQGFSEGTSQEYSPGSPHPDSLSPDPYEADLDRRLALTMPEREAKYAAELACPSPPPPDVDEVVDALLEDLRPHRATPEFCPTVQRLTPPIRWPERHTPSPPPPDRWVPSPGEIVGWAERLDVADLVVHIADRYFPSNWDVPAGSAAKRRLHWMAMLQLTEGCMPWPSWQCRHCVELGVP